MAFFKYELLKLNKSNMKRVFETYVVPERKPCVWAARRGAKLTKLPICKAQGILKPECTIVHEASFKIWQDFAATQQMGEFPFKHYVAEIATSSGSLTGYPSFYSPL
jgi:hypothetical protein